MTNSPLQIAHWRLALRNLNRNKRRSISTGLAIALGFSAMLAIGGYINRVEKYLRIYTIFGQRTGHIVIYKKGGYENFYVRPQKYSLTPEDTATIQEVVRTEGIAAELMGGILTGQGLIGNGCRTFPFLAMGIDPALDRALREHPLVTRWTQKFKNFSRGRGISEYGPEVGAIAIGEGLAKILHKEKVYDEFPANHRPQLIADCLAPDVWQQTSADANVQLAAGTWSGMLTALDAEIVANFNTGVTETNSSAVVTSLTHLQKLYDTANVSTFAIWLADPSTLKTDVARLDKALAARGVEVDIYTWLNEDLAPFYAGTMSFLRTMVGFVTFILATVVVLSIFNAATMTVIERSQEIGMMRSLGFTRGQIKAVFLREIMLLAGIALLGGAAIAAIGIKFVNSLQITFSPPGVAGSIQLLLEPNIETIITAFLVIPLLAVSTTLVAIRSMVHKSITLLLMGSNR